MAAFMLFVPEAHCRPGLFFLCVWDVLSSQSPTPVQTPRSLQEPITAPGPHSDHVPIWNNSISEILKVRFHALATTFSPLTESSPPHFWVSNVSTSFIIILCPFHPDVAYTWSFIIFIIVLPSTGSSSLSTLLACSRRDRQKPNLGLHRHLLSPVLI